MDPIVGQTQGQVPPQKKFFDENNYVVMSDVITKERAADLTQYLFDLAKDGKTEKDPQCPLSDAIYGAPRYDELLQELAPALSHHIGVNLLPAYTYARIYRPGEELKIHKDRPSCEYSATMTLGHAADEAIWPIFFDDVKRHKIQLGVGELAMYKGCEVAHWRPPFKGTWQVQIFFHYVNADGPYKHHYADGRKEFGKPKGPDNMRADFIDAEKSGVHQQIQTSKIEEPKPVMNTDYPDTIPQPEQSSNGLQHAQQEGSKFRLPILGAPVMLQSMDETFPGYLPIIDSNFSQLKFTIEQCQRIINISKNTYPDDAGVGGGEGKGVVEKKIRDAELYPVHLNQENAWIFEHLGKIISGANTHHFDYDLAGITHSLQLLHYRHKPDEETSGHYNWHIDSGPGHSAMRKISMSVQLSDPKYYQGGELEVFDHGGPVVAAKEQGSVHLFPSYMPHKVHPMTSGERWSLVIWVHGYRRFR